MNDVLSVHALGSEFVRYLPSGASNNFTSKKVPNLLPRARAPKGEKSGEGSGLSLRRGFRSLIISYYQRALRPGTNGQPRWSRVTPSRNFFSGKYITGRYTHLSPLEDGMQILTKQEVVAQLHISERTLETWVRDGKFPKPLRVGKRVLWTKEAVERWKKLSFAFQLEFNPR